MGTIAGEYKTLKIALDGSIAKLTFSQPEKANAMTRDFWDELPRALDQIEQTNDLRALIISGDGKHFSSGMDLSLFAGNPALNCSNPRERERLRRLIVELQDLFSRLEHFHFPVITAVQGACLGAAFDLVCASDLRYATKQAYFCIQEINIGMMADLGVLQRLPKLIPDGVARELAFTGDKLPAERALQLGLLSAVFDSEEEMHNEVNNVARKIAARSPLAVASSKESLNFARDNSVQAALSQAAILQSSIIDPEDLGRAAQAAAKKTEANFDKLLASVKI